MYDNRLAGYVLTTGGDPGLREQPERHREELCPHRQEAATSTRIVYASHEPLIDSKYRKIEVRVDRPGVEVIAKKGYYPSGQDYQH